jgi:2-oxoglutarate dehydrogenase E1 component
MENLQGVFIFFDIRRNMDRDLSYLNLTQLPAVEELYARYLVDPQSVDSSWRHFFEGVEFSTLFLPSKGSALNAESPDSRIDRLIEAYRVYGHLLAKVNVLELSPSEEVKELSLETLGFKKEELQNSFPTSGFLKEPEATLDQIIQALKKTYSGTIGVEYMGCGNPALEAWLQKRIEPYFELGLNDEDRLQILHFLNKAELFEVFLHTKYVGQKRFSLEGGETLIPMLEKMVERGAEGGLDEVVLGMAHRGRLNVLANILNKSYMQIFHEFEDFYSPELSEGTGDVKYHKGFEGTLMTRRGQRVKITLAANPSHLESVDPVVVGEVRGKQQHRERGESERAVIPIVIHGDASIAGQGVVYETLELSRLRGYETGGTIHMVINNQIGFTTLPKDGRSTRYCTDIAKVVGAPVFHVNAEDPEGCASVAQIAIEIREKFQCDVFIDLNGYRKYGHNEGDEPLFTQPLEYQLIKDKKSIRTLYCDQLIARGVLSREKADALEEEFKQELHTALGVIKREEPSPVERAPLPKEDPFARVEREVSQSTLIDLARRFCRVPEGFHIHPKIQRHLAESLAALEGDPKESKIDWGMGETLCYATLLVEGVHVRLSGQDSRRGTFSHRHAMWVDQIDEGKYFPLSHLKEGQALFDIFNSPLSEFAVLGFEFGYSLSFPEALVIWEAQFGDFCNGAQVIIDQYIATSEQKWGLRSAIVLMLPHGYEGQGPEHSSARIERFLQLSGDDNMRLVNCTTPAQLFHLLRRQSHCKVKKPLVIFTPKALLRHPLCVNSLSDFSSGAFEEILDDPHAPSKVKRLLFCSGKIFYNLITEREKRKSEGVAILRLEQLYPLNRVKLQALIDKYRGFRESGWVQEEPNNMGAWNYIQPLLEELLKQKLFYIGHDRRASPATGFHALHKKQYDALMEEAFKNWGT